MLRMPTLSRCRTIAPDLKSRWRVVVAVSAACFGLALLPGGSRAADVFAGQKTYQAHCVRCHGDEGRPVLPDVPDFYQGEGLSASDGSLVRSIKAGGNLMPSFNRIIKDRDILNALAYIRTLQR